ncbi:hypothetical protein ACJX0J_016309, partial [Zea mays]
AAMNQSSGRYISLRDTLNIMEFLVTLKSEFYLMDVFISVITFCSQLMIKGTNKIMPTLLHVLLVSQEQAAENGIIPHLMKFVMSDSPLRQKVEQALLKKEAIQNLVKFFQDCPEQFFGHILDAFLKIIT